MRWEDRNVSLYDIGNICHDDWKSRQHAKRQEDRYKEHLATNSAAQLMDEVLKSIIKQLIASDSEIRKRIEDIIDKYIKEDKWLTIKKSLTVIYAIVLLIIGAGLKWIFSQF